MSTINAIIIRLNEYRVLDILSIIIITSLCIMTVSPLIILCIGINNIFDNNLIVYDNAFNLIIIAFNWIYIIILIFLTYYCIYAYVILCTKRNINIVMIIDLIIFMTNGINVIALCYLYKPLNNIILSSQSIDDEIIFTISSNICIVCLLVIICIQWIKYVLIIL